jgi:AcrR family transcriptional regulator
MANSSAAVAKILALTPAEIERVGVDGLSVAKIAELAKIARSTVYNHFEDIDALLAELWAQRGLEWLDRLADAESFGRQDGSELATFDLAFTEIFAVAHRMPELGQLVFETTQAWWGGRVEPDSAAEQFLAWRVGTRLGVELSLGVTPSISAANKTIALVAGIVDEPKAGSRASAATARSNAPRPRLVADPFVDFAGEEERILLAAIKVIAGHGVANASMARIARRAGVTKGMLYPRFNDLDTIIAQGFRLALIRVVDSNTSSISETGLSPEVLMAISTNSFTEDRRVWRQFRTELHVAARHNPSLAANMAEAFEATRVALAELAANYTSVPSQVMALTQSMQATSVGWPVLFANGVPMASINFLPLYSELERRVRAGAEATAK